MEMNELAHAFWDTYLATLDIKPENPEVESGIAGNEEIADELLELYLSGKKTAGSGLVKDYEMAGDPLPKVGNFWIILNAKKEPKCIVKTTRVEFCAFKDVTQEIVNAEGEGDLSIDHWREAHVRFFTPYLSEWGISDLDNEKLVTEFYEVVFK